MRPNTIRKAAIKIGVGVPAMLVLAPVVPWLVLVLYNPLTDWVTWIMPGVWADAYQEERVSFGIVDKMLSLAEWVAAGGVLAALVVAIASAVAFVVWGAFHLLGETARAERE